MVVEMPRLGALFVADEDRWCAAIIELLQVRLHRLDVRHTPECVQIVDIGPATMSGLVRRHAIDGLGRRPILQVHDGCDRLAPEHCRHLSALQQTPGHSDHGLVPPLDDTILLWCVWRSVLPLDAALDAVRLELNGGELTPVVSSQYT
jgi:hypothetical protein